nr:hypothetical protein [Bacillus sp. J33]
MFGPVLTVTTFESEEKPLKLQTAHHTALLQWDGLKMPAVSIA